MSQYIFISPHLDDIVLSCGAIVDHLNSIGHQIEIWTFFAGNPPPGPFSPFALSLHHRWQLPENPVLIRRLEDSEACKVLGVVPKHFDIPDCIYRLDEKNLPLVSNEEDLYQPVPPHQFYLIQYIYQILNDLSPQVILVSPISIGNHIDHRIVRAAVDQLKNKKILFYADYPYNLHNNDDLIKWVNPKWKLINYPINPKHINHWIEAVSCHKSQISTFWENEKELDIEIRKYARRGGGKSLWLNDITISFP